jgi:hypothetical protein
VQRSTAAFRADFLVILVPLNVRNFHLVRAREGHTARPSMRTSRIVADRGRWRRSEGYGGRMRSMPGGAAAAVWCCRIEMADGSRYPGFISSLQDSPIRAAGA